MTSTPSIQLLRPAEAHKTLALGRTAVTEAISAGLLPPAIPLGARAIGYLKHELEAVIVARETLSTSLFCREKRRCPRSQNTSTKPKTDLKIFSTRALLTLRLTGTGSPAITQVGPLLTQLRRPLI